MAIRPHVSTLWERAGKEERARFLRHLRPIWEVSLHRAPPRAALLLDRGRAEGWFQHEAARLTGLNAAPGGRILARLRRRGRTAEETVVADAVINFTGASYDWSRSRGGFNARLLESGLVRPGPLSFGVDADAQCAVVGRDGMAAADLSVIGPALRGVRWESNTLVEILQQAIQLANRLSLLPPRAASAVSELTTVETTKAS
jgi:uncharacterized NAD(P)/FAD-binding protein YdhS